MLLFFSYVWNSQFKWFVFLKLTEVCLEARVSLFYPMETEIPAPLVDSDNSLGWMLFKIESLSHLLVLFHLSNGLL
jgi:hypothetical protein